MYFKTEKISQFWEEKFSTRVTRRSSARTLRFIFEKSPRIASRPTRDRTSKLERTGGKIISMRKGLAVPKRRFYREHVRLGVIVSRRSDVNIDTKVREMNINTKL